MQAEGIRAIGATVDLTDAAAVNAAIAEVDAQAGRIDMLVNNAGAVRDKRFLTMSDDDWDLVIDTNLRSQFLCCRAVLPGMVERGYGPHRQHLVARLARRLRPGQLLGGQGRRGQPDTQSLAIEFAAKGVTVNAIAPGIVDTPLFRDFAPEVQTRLKASVPVKRIGTAEDIANAVDLLPRPDVVVRHRPDAVRLRRPQPVVAECLRRRHEHPIRNHRCGRAADHSTGPRR